MAQPAATAAVRAALASPAQQGALDAAADAFTAMGFRKFEFTRRLRSATGATVARCPPRRPREAAPWMTAVAT